MQDTAGQADAEVQLAATLASLEAKASRDITTLFSSTLDAGFNAQLTLIKQDLASVRAATRELEILAEEEDREEQAQRLLEVLKGHRSEYERLQAAFKQAHVQARRNTDAAAAAARKALLAGAEAGRPPVAAAAQQANTVAVSQGVTHSLQRTRQLMAQELEHTSATLAALDASADRLQQGKEELQSHSGLFASSRRLLRTLFTSSILDAVSLYGGLAIFFLVVAYILQKRTFYFAPVHRVVGPIAGSAWNRTRGLAASAQAHALAWNPARLSKVQQQILTTGTPEAEAPQGAPPEWAAAEPDPFADFPTLSEELLPSDDTALQAGSIAGAPAASAVPQHAAASTHAAGPANASAHQQPQAVQGPSSAGNASSSAGRQQPVVEGAQDAGNQTGTEEQHAAAAPQAHEAVPPDEPPMPPPPVATDVTPAPEPATSTPAAEDVAIPREATDAAMPPEPLPTPDAAEPAAEAAAPDAVAEGAPPAAAQQAAAAGINASQGSTPLPPQTAAQPAMPAAQEMEPAVPAAEPWSKNAVDADRQAVEPSASTPPAGAGDPAQNEAADESQQPVAIDSIVEEEEKQQPAQQAQKHAPGKQESRSGLPQEAGQPQQRQGSNFSQADAGAAQGSHPTQAAADMAQAASRAATTDAEQSNHTAAAPAVSQNSDSAQVAAAASREDALPTSGKGSSDNASAAPADAAATASDHNNSPHTSEHDSRSSSKADKEAEPAAVAEEAASTAAPAAEPPHIVGPTAKDADAAIPAKGTAADQQQESSGSDAHAAKPRKHTADELQHASSDGASDVAGRIMPPSDLPEADQLQPDAAPSSTADPASLAPAENASGGTDEGPPDAEAAADAADALKVAGEDGQVLEWRWNANKGQRGVWELWDADGKIVHESEPEEEGSEGKDARDVEPLPESAAQAEAPAVEREPVHSREVLLDEL